MSGDSLRVPNGVSLSAATSDLVLAARKDILLKDTQLEGSREVAIRSLRDINLNNVTMGAKNMATIRATQDLNVNGLRFSSIQDYHEGIPFNTMFIFPQQFV